MRVRRRFAFLITGFLVASATVTAFAGNWSVITRHFEPPPTYGCHPRRPCPDCQMPWQPVRSVLHYNVLPPGMLRPWPLSIPAPSLAPRTPDFGCGLATGCGLTPSCRP